MADLTKTPAYTRLQIGDPWTFIMPQPLWLEDSEPPRSAEIGDHVSKWFDTSEPGRKFRITAIHGNAYETIYEGFIKPATTHGGRQ